MAEPEQFRLDVLIARWLYAWNDPREVVTDRTVRYFDALLDERTLLPWFNTTIGMTHFADWLSHSAPVNDRLGQPVAAQGACSGRR